MLCLTWDYWMRFPSVHICSYIMCLLAMPWLPLETNATLLWCNSNVSKFFGPQRPMEAQHYLSLNKLGTWFFRMLGVCLLSQYAWGALAIITCVTSLLGLSRVPSRGSALIPASLSALLLPVHWASLLLPLPDPACPHTTDRGFFLKTPLTKTVWFKA